MAKKHKKHKKHRSNPFAYGSEGFIQDGSSQDSDVLGEHMKVVLKLPGTARHEVSSRHSRIPVLSGADSAEPVSPELLVSIPLVLLRPVTPSPFEEEKEEEDEPDMEEVLPQHHKHHKVKKHKKHKKHIHELSHPLPGDGLQQSHSTGHMSNLIYQASPIIQPLGGKSSSQTWSPSLSSSPFKFKISTSRSEGSLSGSSSDVTFDLERKEGSSSSHKHKKRHHHHHHHGHHHHGHHHHSHHPEEGPIADARQETVSSSLTAEVGSGARGTMEGKPLAMFLSREAQKSEVSVGSEVNIKMPAAQGFMETPVKSHDQGAVSHDVEGARPHKKKKEKKKKHKHSHSHQLPPLTTPPQAAPPTSATSFSTAKPIAVIPQKRARDASSSSPSGLELESPSHKRLRVNSSPSPEVLEARSSSNTKLTLTTTPQQTPTPPPALHTAMPPDTHTPRRVSPPKVSPPAQPAAPNAPGGPVPVQVKLSSNALKFFLKNLHHLIQKRDPEGIFAEPVTDDIAPGYSAIIKVPMDLATMATKVDSNLYHSVKDFKADFILMCNNAMTYNSPETMYYATAKRLLSSGLQIIAKETSLRPDIMYGHVPSRSSSMSPLPPSLPFTLPAPSSTSLNYSSPFLCRLPLHLIQKPRPSAPAVAEHVETEFVNIDKLGGEEVSDQSHLTKVSVGFEEEDVQDVSQDMEEVLEQVEEEASAVKENLDANRPNVKYSFLDQSSSGQTMLNILNPDTSQRENTTAIQKVMIKTLHPTCKALCVHDPLPKLMRFAGTDHFPSVAVKSAGVGEGSFGPEEDRQGQKEMATSAEDSASRVDSSKPVDLTVLSDRIRMGNNAATVLKTELPMMKATPVSYLMYGPFGSFAPVYDSAFATLSKMDSDLLLSTYGSDLGISYAHSLQQFVRGTEGFVSEMANAVLNGLTNNRHSWFSEKLKALEKKESKQQSKSGAEKEASGDAAGLQQSKSGAEKEASGDAAGLQQNKSGAEKEASGDAAGLQQNKSGAEKEASGDGLQAKDTGAAEGVASTGGDVERQTSGDSVMSEVSAPDQTNDKEGKESSGLDIPEDSNDAPVNMEGTKDAPVDIEGTKDAPIAMEGTKDAPVNMEGTEDAPVDIEGTNDAPVDMEDTKDAPVDIEGTKDAPVNMDGTKDAPVDMEGTKDTPVNMEGTKDAPVDMEGAKDAPVDMEGIKDDNMGSNGGNTEVCMENTATGEHRGVEKITVRNINLEDSGPKDAKSRAEPRRNAVDCMVPASQKSFTSSDLDTETTKELELSGSVSRELGLVSRELSAEGSVLRELSVEGSVSRELSAEGSLSRELSAEGLVSRELSAEGSVSRELSAEGSVSGELGTEGSVSRELSTEGSVSRELSAEGSVSIELSAEGSVSRELSAEGSVSRDLSPFLVEDSTSSQTPADICGDIDAGLFRTSSLLSQLHTHQLERLSLPPYISEEGHLLLPGPSEQEVGVASKVREELASLVGAAQPGDLTSVPALQQAMGLNLDLVTSQSDDASLDSDPTPVSNAPSTTSD